ncbi:hypothetical protein BVC80_8835g16 [Macleaya cordata]|uniref:Heat shock protein DnaJ n=1 Tax=Macleaya cordata TaxID=56857 RepID=A0A200RE02_MACCD|nr:hypothetical protein BVC80_8835g16 [Macleaya cordata]
MAKLSVCCSFIITPSMLPSSPRHFSPHECKLRPEAAKTGFTTFAAKSDGFLSKFSTNGCQTCRGQGAIECPGCKGTGKNKKNGNIFERWKCYDCQGFGLKSCPNCGKGGLTPEQRGER